MHLFVDMHWYHQTCIIHIACELQIPYFFFLFISFLVFITFFIQVRLLLQTPVIIYIFLNIFCATTRRLLADLDIFFHEISISKKNKYMWCTHILTKLCICTGENLFLNYKPINETNCEIKLQLIYSSMN